MTAEQGFNLIVNITAEYPYLYQFLVLVSAFIGFCMALTVFWYLVRVNITQTLSPEQFNWGLAIPALLIAAGLGAFTTTLHMVANSVIDSGGGSLFPPAAISGKLTPEKMIGAFAEQTSRMLGYIFALWGMGEMFVSRMPQGDRSMMWKGIIRLVIGAALIRMRAFGNLFGGLGDAFFR